MRHVLLKDEENVKELATRLFRLQGKGSQAATKQAADALLTANPQLKDISNLPAGSLVVVPDSAPPLAAQERAIASGVVRSATAQNIQDALDSLQQRLSGFEATAASQVSAATEQMQSPEFKSAVATVAAANFSLPTTQSSKADTSATSSRATLKNIQAAQDARQKLLSQVRSAVSTFTKG